MRYIVSIPDEGDLQPGSLLLHFQDREIVGERLTGMAVIGEPIDNRNAGILCHLLHDLVITGTDHDRLHHALQVPGHVID